MTIELITKNKVADYIQQNPEAYIYLMTWIKESQSGARRRLFDTNTPDGTAIVLSQLGASKYFIKLKVNIWHKTAYIMFFGTREEEMAYMDKEIAEYEAKNPGAKITRVVKTATVTIKAPPIPPEIFGHHETAITTSQSDLDAIQPVGNEFVFPDNIAFDYGNNMTIDEYEGTLERLVSIFNALPDTDEFKELTALLPLIKSYESANVKLPQFNAIEAIKLRLRDFHMIPENLARSIGDEENIDLFFAGKQLPSDKSIEKIYNQLGLRLTVNKEDFIMK